MNCIANEQYEEYKCVLHDSVGVGRSQHSKILLASDHFFLISLGTFDFRDVDSVPFPNCGFSAIDVAVERSLLIKQRKTLPDRESQKAVSHQARQKEDPSGEPHRYS